MSQAQSGALPPVPPTPALPDAPVPVPSTPGVLARDAAIRELFRVSGVPANERQLAGLRVRREELRTQLERTLDRRGELREQLKDEPEADGRQLLKQQLDAASGQVLSLQERIATTEQQIAAAPPELLASTQPATPAPDMGHYVVEDEAAAAAFGAFGFGIVATLVVGRLQRWRRRGRTAVVPTPPDAQLQQLGVAVDAIALEVERIGEGQRFVTQLLAEGSAGQPALRVSRRGPDGTEVTADVPGRIGGAAAARIPTPH